MMDLSKHLFKAFCPSHPKSVSIHLQGTVE